MFVKFQIFALAILLLGVSCSGADALLGTEDLADRPGSDDNLNFETQKCIAQPDVLKAIKADAVFNIDILHAITWNHHLSAGTDNGVTTDSWLHRAVGYMRTKIFCLRGIVQNIMDDSNVVPKIKALPFIKEKGVIRKWDDNRYSFDDRGRWGLPGLPPIFVKTRFLWLWDPKPNGQFSGTERVTLWKGDYYQDNPFRGFLDLSKKYKFGIGCEIGLYASFERENGSANYGAWFPGGTAARMSRMQMILVDRKGRILVANSSSKYHDRISNARGKVWYLTAWTNKSNGLRYEDLTMYFRVENFWGGSWMVWRGAEGNISRVTF